MIRIDRNRALALAAVVALLAVMEAAMLLSVRQESQTSDEAYSLFAGYLHLTEGDFAICPGYPPLVKDVAALPLLVYRPILPPMNEAQVSTFQGGRIFLYTNRADVLLFAARATMTVFPLLLAALVFLAAWEMFGAGPAFLSLVLMVFEPNLLAHGPLVTNDVPLACCVFASVYAFWRYVTKPSGWRLAACGVAAGLTLAAKHSGIILFPILFLLGIIDLLLGAKSAQQGEAPVVPGRPVRNERALKQLWALAVVVGASVVVLWSFYYFRYAARPEGMAPSPALGIFLSAERSPAVAKVISLMARAHLLPEAYLTGIAFFRTTDTRPTFLLGKLYPRGVWYYFPIAILIKCTLGMLLLLLLAALAPTLRDRARRREVVWMAVPAAAFLLAGMASHLNIGIRHILPVFPFLVVLAATGAWGLAQRNRAWAGVIAVLVVFHAVSSLHAFPNYLPYSNEAWGGPQKTYRVLTDSNVDWGQGLPAVKKYLDAHSDQPCWLAYFGTVDPQHFDIPCNLMTSSVAEIWGRPLGQIPAEIQGNVLISATELSGQAWGQGELNPYAQFRSLRPVDCIAGSVLVYRGTFQIPLASALSRVWKIVALANSNQLGAAITEARAAESLAPQSVDIQFVLGRVLKAAGRNDEAQQAFATALQLAQTVHPESQGYWVPIIQQEMSGR